MAATPTIAGTLRSQGSRRFELGRPVERHAPDVLAGLRIVARQFEPHNITWRGLINETWVSKPLAQANVIPPDEELFGRDIMDAVGRRELVS